MRGMAPSQTSLHHPIAEDDEMDDMTASELGPYPEKFSNFIFTLVSNGWRRNYSNLFAAPTRSPSAGSLSE